MRVYINESSKVLNDFFLFCFSTLLVNDEISRCSCKKRVKSENLNCNSIFETLFLRASSAFVMKKKIGNFFLLLVRSVWMDLVSIEDKKKKKLVLSYSRIFFCRKKTVEKRVREK